MVISKDSITLTCYYIHYLMKCQNSIITLVQSVIDAVSWHLKNAHYWLIFINSVAKVKWPRPNITCSCYHICSPCIIPWASSTLFEHTTPAFISPHHCGQTTMTQSSWYGEYCSGKSSRHNGRMWRSGGNVWLMSGQKLECNSAQLTMPLFSGANCRRFQTYILTTVLEYSE